MKTKPSFPLVALALQALSLFILQNATADSFTTTGSLNTPRSAHTATLLPNGKVLVAGGENENGTNMLSSAEIYDPALGTWAGTGAMITGRLAHRATLLPNGKVLVTGGVNSTNDILSKAELYDPATGTWAGAGQMSVVRLSHSATLLPNGKVLIAGGFTDVIGELATAELYDPATGTWAATGSMAVPRDAHKVTLLPNGKVLVTGGYNIGTGDLASAELYDPATGTWAGAGQMSAARYSHTVTLLPDGKVLIAGGVGTGLIATNIAELFDPAAGTWTTIGGPNFVHFNHTANLLPDGDVLIAGGNSTTYCAELFHPATGTWTLNALPDSTLGRIYHTATLLTNGKVLFAGGNECLGCDARSSAKLFSKTAETPTGSLTVTLNPGGVVSEGARWQVDYGAFLESGAVVTNLCACSHTISFSTVSGWLTPSNQIVTLTAGTTNSASGTYITHRGDLQVTLNPPEVTALGVRWQVDGGALQNSGAVVTNLLVGDHTVSFSTVAGWATPSNQIVTVNENVITPVTGTYTIITKTWNGSASTDWLNPTNWTPFGVPAAQDTVILNLSGSTINFSAPVTHNGPFRWIAGRISGVPDSFTLGSNAVMTLSPGNYKYLSGTVFNDGRIQTTNNIILYVDNNPPALLVNLPGGVIDSTGEDFFDNGGAVGGVIENRGLFRKSGGGDTIINSSLIFTNVAMVDIQTNALLVAQGWHIGATYTGAGQLRLFNDNHLRGDVTFSNAFFQTGTFDASDARLHGTMTWVTGTLGTSTNAACVVAGDATLTLVSGFHKYLAGTLTNEGLVRLTGNTDLYFFSAPVCRLVNAAAGVFDSTGTDTFVGDGLPNRFFENRGLFRKSGGADTVILGSVTFTNSATVHIQTNALLVAQGWHVGATYTGAGQLRLFNDNHFRGDVTFSNALFQSGTLDASDARLHGTMTWVTGTLGTSTNAACVVAGDATLTLVPGFHKFLAGTLTNEGLVRLTGNTDLYFFSAPVCRLVNAAAGVLDSTGNDNFYGDGSPDRFLENYGVLRKSGGQGNTTFASSVGLFNPGVFDLQTGVLQLNGTPTGIASEIRVSLNSITNYGRLSVAGPLTLGGSLRVTRAPSFVPALNDTFHIVTATSRTGTFTGAGSFDLNNGLVVTITNLPVGVDLIVTEPDLRPVITAPVLTGGQISFQFLSATGAVYSIEYNDDLNTTNWLPRLTIPGDGLLHVISEPATNYPARFFRIMRQ